MENSKKNNFDEGDLYLWIADFFSEKKIKPHHSVEISHDLTEQLADYLYLQINRKLKYYEGKKNKKA
jgi:hypothetical protein